MLLNVSCDRQAPETVQPSERANYMALHQYHRSFWFTVLAWLGARPPCTESPLGTDHLHLAPRHRTRSRSDILHLRYPWRIRWPRIVCPPWSLDWTAPSR